MNAFQPWSDTVNLLSGRGMTRGEVLWDEPDDLSELPRRKHRGTALLQAIFTSILFIMGIGAS